MVKRQRETKTVRSSSLCWFILHMPRTAKTGSHPGKEPRIQSMSPMRVTDTQVLEPSSAATHSVHRQKAEFKVKELWLGLG